ncbi:hypothetical protein ACFE04_005708 [Oxalis oulophora]
MLFDWIVVEKELVASSSLDEVLVGRHENFIVGVAKMTLEGSLEIASVNTEEETRSSTILEATGYLEEVQALMPEVSSAGKNALLIFVLSYNLLSFQLGKMFSL